MINGGREKGWTILGNGGGGREGGGGGGVLWGVIEFLSPPALSELRLSVWLSVLGADRQVSAWTDCLTSGPTGQDSWEVGVPQRVASSPSRDPHKSCTSACHMT